MRFRIVLVITSIIILFFLVFTTRNNIVTHNSEAISDNIGVLVNKKEIEENTPRYLSSISIDYLRSLEFEEQDIVIEQELSDGSNYKRYIASYNSDGYKIYGLLTIPNEEPPQGGHKAIVFNHGYIPPTQYKTTEKYVAYVDYLARNNFIVFKIDMRGHGESEGTATGTYFSPAYTIDAINAVNALQSMEEVNPDKIGMWGHSMSGNLTMRSMLVSDKIKAGVIWAGAVYSYEDFGKYGLNDSSYRGRPRNTDDNNETNENQNDPSNEDNTLNNRSRISNEYVSKLREAAEEINYFEPFWKSISLTQNIGYLSGPIQLHHAENDTVVNIGYAKDLAEVLENNNLEYELHEYPGGGHNINDPHFSTAMQRTVDFFNDNL